MKTKHTFHRAVKRLVGEDASWPAGAVLATLLLLLFAAVLRYWGPLHLDRSAAEALVMVGLTLMALAVLPWQQ